MDHALNIGEGRKMAAHANACRSVGVTFIPLIVESIGGWAPRAVDVIKGIGCLQGQRLGIPSEEFITLPPPESIYNPPVPNVTLLVRRIPVRPSEVGRFV